MIPKYTDITDLLDITLWKKKNADKMAFLYSAKTELTSVPGWTEIRKTPHNAAHNAN